MPDDSQQSDFTLTYSEVERLLGRGRRSIQNYVANGELTKQLQPDPQGSGQRAYFSEAEVKKLARQLGAQGEKPEQQIARYEGGFGAMMPQVKQMQETIEAQNEQIQQLATQKGEMQGKLSKVEDLLEAKESEIATRSEHSEQLEQEKAKLEKQKIRLEGTVQQERYRARITHLAYAALALLIAGVVVLLSPLTADFISSLITR